MARPIQNGLSYFPLDVDFFSDPNVKILKVKYGTDGIMLYLYLLCQIYREGYYIKVDKDFDYIIANDLSMSVDAVMQVRAYLLERSMFDEQLFQSAEVLTSAGIQRRYQEAIKNRAEKRGAIECEFWLLPEEETKSFIKTHPHENKSEKNPDKSEKNGDKSEKNALKKSKEKKSKLKQNNMSGNPDDIAGIIGYLNQKAGTHYRLDSSETVKHLKARFEEGYTAEDCRKVIDNVVSAWKGTKMEAYIRPITIFSPSKFENYLNGKIGGSSYQPPIPEYDYPEEA